MSLATCLPSGGQHARPGPTNAGFSLLIMRIRGSGAPASDAQFWPFAGNSGAFGQTERFVCPMPSGSPVLRRMDPKREPGTPSRRHNGAGPEGAGLGRRVLGQCPRSRSHRARLGPRPAGRRRDARRRCLRRRPRSRGRRPQGLRHQELRASPRRPLRSPSGRVHAWPYLRLTHDRPWTTTARVVRRSGDARFRRTKSRGARRMELLQGARASVTSRRWRLRPPRQRRCRARA